MSETAFINAREVQPVKVEPRVRQPLLSELTKSQAPSLAEVADGLRDGHIDPSKELSQLTNDVSVKQSEDVKDTLPEAKDDEVEMIAPSTKRVWEADNALIEFLKDQPGLYSEIHSAQGSAAGDAAWERFAAEHPENAEILEKFGYKKYELPETIEVIESETPRDEEDEEKEVKKPEEEAEEEKNPEAEEAINKALKNVWSEIIDIPGAQAWIAEEVGENGERIQVIKRYIPGKVENERIDIDTKLQTTDDDWFAQVLDRMIARLEKWSDDFGKKGGRRITPREDSQGRVKPKSIKQPKRGTPLAAKRVQQKGKAAVRV